MPPRRPLVLIAGGGTGGHVFPALAVAAELVAAGAAVEFAGTARGFEARLVPSAGYTLHTLPVRGLRGKSPIDLIRGGALLPIAFARAIALVGRLRPDAVLGVGGYASGPALAAAWCRRVPIALHEQNAIPGLTNQVLARLARIVAVSFEASRGSFARPVVVTGNPVRAAFFEIPPVLPAVQIRLLIFGGSQGSRVINRAVAAALPLLAGAPLEIVHQTGEADLAEVRTPYAGSSFATARVVPFLDDMPAAFAAADLILSRAGATTSAELAAAGRGALLVPFAAAAGGHQEANARALVAAGAAEIMLERDLDGARLAARLRDLAGDPGRLADMGARARTLARPDAARDVARLVLGLVRGR
jgi:UDP-N-acetylglucosamine--N-acetylmuramyl-(pentapeptide) pyrophosphoryl-undecaprenol N-acetylglucosamine transferase